MPDSQLRNTLDRSRNSCRSYARQSVEDPPSDDGSYDDSDSYFSNGSLLTVRGRFAGGIFVTVLALMLVGGVAGPAHADENDDEPNDARVSEAEMQLIRRAEAARVRTIERVYGTVVSIFGDDRKKGGGSGVIFDPAGYALTNHHVVASAGPRGWAGLADGELYRWKLCGTDPGGDIAIIQLDGRDHWPAAALGRSDQVRVGQWVLAMGNPFVLAQDYTPTVTLGIVSGIERYQGGGLIYGNCIQVDSSINPGNSGGPLMNMAGQVIGINGRAAFDKRGRVNVGVGFAVSSEQVKNFLPDLLAAKVAQHGTLDAQFSMRDGEVICDAINLDSRVARAGLQLGDRLLELNGIKIVNSNQLANLISMLPAQWPVDLVYEHQGERFPMCIRLSAMTYQPPPAPPADPDEQEDKGDRPPPEEDDGKDAERKQPDARRDPGAWLQGLQPGAIRDLALNRACAGRLIGRWQDDMRVGPPEPDTRAVAIEADVSENGKVVGRQSMVIALDGRFLVQLGDDEAVIHDGKNFVSVKGDRTERLTPPVALDRPEVLAATLLAAAARGGSLAEFGQVMGPVMLDGGDRVQQRRAYRLKASGPTAEPLYLWLSLYGQLGKPQTQLLKAGFDQDGTVRRPAITFEDWRQTGHLMMPFRSRLVVGLREQPQREWVVQSCQMLAELPNLLVVHDANAAAKKPDD